MCDITNPTGLQISAGRKFGLIYNFKIMDFLLYIQLYTTLS